MRVKGSFFFLRFVPAFGILGGADLHPMAFADRRILPPQEFESEGVGGDLMFENVRMITVFDDFIVV